MRYFSRFPSRSLGNKTHTSFSSKLSSTSLHFPFWKQVIYSNVITFLVANLKFINLSSVLMHTFNLLHKRALWAIVTWFLLKNTLEMLSICLFLSLFFVIKKISIWISFWVIWLLFVSLLYVSINKSFLLLKLESESNSRRMQKPTIK